jgi:PTS system nitrogen regulatory IIA component
MRLTELLSEERVAIRHHDGTHPLDKPGTLKVLAEMLAKGAHLDVAAVERVLTEREQLQSTGIGEGVAIPHGALPQLETQFASLLIVPEGSSSRRSTAWPVNILFAVITPKRATGEHLKTLARVSRVLRNKGFRERLMAVSDPKEGYSLISNEEGDR